MGAVGSRKEGERASPGMKEMEDVSGEELKRRFPSCQNSGGGMI